VLCELQEVFGNICKLILRAKSYGLYISHPRAMSNLGGEGPNEPETKQQKLEIMLGIVSMALHIFDHSYIPFFNGRSTHARLLPGGRTRSRVKRKTKWSIIPKCRVSDQYLATIDFSMRLCYGERR
jgi:hypothetical protein